MWKGNKNMANGSWEPSVPMKLGGGIGKRYVQCWIKIPVNINHNLEGTEISTSHSLLWVMQHMKLLHLVAHATPHHSLLQRKPGSLPSTPGSYSNCGSYKRRTSMIRTIILTLQPLMQNLTHSTDNIFCKIQG